jgi:protocatechuate 3,4-dioxygenase beta subunit
MKRFYLIGILLSLCNIFTSCQGQKAKSEETKEQIAENPSQQVGGPFENDDATYLGMPAVLNAIDTSAGWTQDGPKLLVTGTVYWPDGKTPAAGVMIYYYHTNTEGRYVHNPDEKRSMPPNVRGQSHGYIRGWVKTGDDGRYSIYTVRPGSYPGYEEPAHIHVTIKEPNEIKEYFIDEILFDDDPFLTTSHRSNLSNRGGSGIIKLTQRDRLYVGERDIILGSNIPGYPGQ